MQYKRRTRPFSSLGVRESSRSFEDRTHPHHQSYDRATIDCHLGILRCRQPEHPTLLPSGQSYGIYLNLSGKSKGGFPRTRYIYGYLGQISVFWRRPMENSREATHGSRSPEGNILLPDGIWRGDKAILWPMLPSTHDGHKLLRLRNDFPRVPS